MITLCLLCIMWYLIVSLSCHAGLGMIYIYDRIKYGPTPIEKIDDDLTDYDYDS
jgi:hypothetical protein